MEANACGNCGQVWPEWWGNRLQGGDVGVCLCGRAFTWRDGAAAIVDEGDLARLTAQQRAAIAQSMREAPLTPERGSEIARAGNVG